MVEEVSTTKAPEAVGPYSQALAGGGVLCVSGQLPINPEDGKMAEDVKAQTYQSLSNLKVVVKAAGLEMSDVLKTTVYLSDIAYFGEMNQVYGEFFEKPYPARAAFQVAALPKGAKVEIEAIVCAGK